MGKRHRLNRRQLSPEQSSYSIRIVCAHERHRGTSIEDTARMMNCSESSVYRYKTRFDESGDVARASYSRDNAVDTEEFRAMLCTLVDDEKDTPFGCPGFKWVHKRVDKTLYPCSLNIVKRSLKRMGYVIKTMSHKPFLTAGHKAARLQLADYFDGWSPDQLSRVVWCDEKTFRCGSHGKKITYLAKITDPPKETPVEMDRWYGGKGVHVFMATSLRWEVPDACFHEFSQNETVTNEVFLRTMKKRNRFFNWMHRRPGAAVVLDNAPGHGAARRIGKLEGIKIIDWPSKSPDLNLIEILTRLKCEASQFSWPPPVYSP